MLDKKSLSAMADAMISGAQKELGHFKERFDQNPVNAFDWSSTTIISAVRQEIWSKIKTVIDNPEFSDEKWAAYIESLKTLALVKATHMGSSSTMASSNEVNKAYAIVLAEAVMMFQDAVL